MKSKIIKISLALAVVAVAGYTVYSSQIETELSEISLENIEAIASGESSNCNYGTVVKDDYSHTLHCSGHGSLCCEW